MPFSMDTRVLCERERKAESVRRKTKREDEIWCVCVFRVSVKVESTWMGECCWPREMSLRVCVLLCLV